MKIKIHITFHMILVFFLSNFSIYDKMLSLLNEHEQWVYIIHHRWRLIIHGWWSIAIRNENIIQNDKIRLRSYSKTIRKFKLFIFFLNCDSKKWSYKSMYIHCVLCTIRKIVSLISKYQSDVFLIPLIRDIQFQHNNLFNHHLNGFYREIVTIWWIKASISIDFSSLMFFSNELHRGFWRPKPMNTIYDSYDPNL